MKEIYELISIRINENIDIMTKELNRYVKELKGKLNARGLLNSTIFIDKLFNHFSDELKRVSENNISEIMLYQEKYNIDFKAGDKSYIKNLFIDKYLKFANTIYNKNICGDKWGVQNIYKGIKERTETRFKNLIDTLQTEITTTIKKYSLIEKIRKNEPAIEQARRANKIAIGASIIAVISIILSLLLK